MMRVPFVACFVAGLAACSGPISQVPFQPGTSELRVRPIVSAIEVRDVTLPRYASEDDLLVAGEDGLLLPIEDTIWAEDPERALTIALADTLGTITNAEVAAEPWPYAGLPGVTVEVRASQLLTSANGTVRFSGQYAIAPVGAEITDRGGRFDIVVPLRTPGPTGIAAAQSAAVSQLAETIARQIGR